VPAEGDELGVLKLSAVSGGHFDASENKQLEEIPEGQVVLSPRRHDLLMTRANTPLLVGDVCVVKEDHANLILPDLIYRLRVDHRVTCVRFVCPD
jgi:type I restriction enzyme S subunit